MSKYSLQRDVPPKAPKEKPQQRPIKAKPSPAKIKRVEALRKKVMF